MSVRCYTLRSPLIFKRWRFTVGRRLIVTVIENDGDEDHQTSKEDCVSSYTERELKCKF